VTDWVLAVERAYVADATNPAGWARPLLAPPHTELPRALAAIGAIASRYLAVGTPRTFGLVIGGADQLPVARSSIEAHATWFSPREVRCALLDGSRTSELGSPATLAEALAADIVCLHVPVELRAAKLRRGTHVNMLAAGTLDADLGAIAVVRHEHPDLGRLAAGLIDGRQLDEITVFVADDAVVALHALSVQ